uniref:Uncharacterized protein n=1 Tax=Anguilla anguilla TaxID=7936 RepID=A0A0E9UZJ6_ANGAN
MRNGYQFRQSKSLSQTGHGQNHSVLFEHDQTTQSIHSSGAVWFIFSVPFISCVVYSIV